MIVLGRLAAPFGVLGWLRLHAFGDDPQSWRAMEQWRVSADPDASAEHWSSLRLKGFKLQGNGPVVHFEGCDDRTAAEKLVGLYVAAQRQDLPDTGKDEYYWGDLIGLDVVNAEGERLGRVGRLMETGANAVLVVVDEGDKPVERLIPFVSAVVKDVDRDAAVVRVEWGAQW
ncbi:MAG: ribosome maturation factor RimM [Gammaproteobacteria bacterium]|jgi:16S rRNA processing protein RimM|nr:ribosome maturation factor RimM [Gammaproteobacteria bacterium]MBU0770447.1 ribosome maturation factor RimM [Gammaproteobacteria bacterium]MBU0855175.1 ribosome maturation factor RimM [Gammaproteobacteria bacterium]MBU1847365.1 ribosome maturation factor RimM [Gammaproteobacteria bacterium]